MRQFVLELCRLENVLKNHEIDHFDIVLKCNVVFERALDTIITLSIPLESLILALSKETKFDRPRLSQILQFEKCVSQFFTKKCSTEIRCLGRFEAYSLSACQKALNG